MTIGAGVSYDDFQAALDARVPVPRRVLAPHRRLAGARHGHDRRQHRQRLADRRHAPALIALGATVTLRKGAARRTLPLEAFFIAYGKQDRAPGEFVE